MDPITGVGLAASVVQLVSFSLAAVKTCKEFYQKGSVGEYDRINYTTGHLASLTQQLEHRRLEQSLQTSSTQSHALTKEEKELLHLAQRCGDCAQKLQYELGKLRTKQQASALEAIQKTARALVKGRTVRKIQEELEKYKLTLETSLLLDLSRRLDLQTLQSSEKFASLDSLGRHIVDSLVRSQASLASLVEQESEQTRQHISAQVNRLEKLYIDDGFYKEITESLYFPSILNRQAQIDNDFQGIENSYDWIFTGVHRSLSRYHYQIFAPKSEPVWSDFPGWLRAGHGVYWINGKPGSGKSTLMNYICNDNRRLDLLQEWCSKGQLLTPSFFFWNTGNRLQKTIDGLLRSLIYQMLIECRALITVIENDPLHAWSERRLLSTLRMLLQQTSIPISVCIFIDGLDEFEGPYDAIVEIITSLASQTHVKICFSSRPSHIFDKAFKEKPGLKLQDLTYQSVCAYVEDQLSHLIEDIVPSNYKDFYRAQDLLHEIVRRAEGVFLWVVLAVRLVRDGLQGLANVNELAREIYELPNELEGLFMRMLKRIGPAFRRDAAKFLRFTLIYDSDLNLSKLHLCSIQNGAKDAPFFYEIMNTTLLAESCRTLKTRLLSHTAGLLDLIPVEEDQEQTPRSACDDRILFTKVNFCHRTVRDFLQGNEEAKAFLDQNSPNEAHIQLCIAKGLLSLLLQFAPQADAPLYIERGGENGYTIFWNAVYFISRAERILGAAQSRLMRSLDSVDFLQGYREICKPYFDEQFCPYMVDGSRGILIDMVGIAADTGMELYVRERLHDTIRSFKQDFGTLDVAEYNRRKSRTRLLTWIRPVEESDMTIQLQSSNYRQTIRDNMQLKIGNKVAAATDVLPEDFALAESYLLSCCSHRDHSLIRYLLHMGADPMVRVHADNNADGYEGTAFWKRWLVDMQYVAMRWPGSSDMIKRDYFDITKLLIGNGADINSKMQLLWAVSRPILSRRYEESVHFHIELIANAMFLLWEYFKEEPEFQRFAAAVEALVERPTRKVTIQLQKCNLLFDDRKDDSEQTYDAYPTEEESEMLLPLIDTFESTRRDSDWEVVNSAAERIWRAHFPDLRLRRDNARENDTMIIEEESEEEESEEGEREEEESEEGEREEEESEDEED